MTTKLFLPTMTLALAALLCAPAAIAQTAGDIVADVPFTFEAAGRLYEPGAYVLHKPGIPGVIQLCRLGEPGGRMMMTLAMEDRDRAGVPALIFARYGERYFLRQVWWGSVTGQELHRSRAEKELAAGDSPVRAFIAARLQTGGQ